MFRKHVSYAYFHTGKNSYGIRFVTAKVGYGKGSHRINVVLKKFVLNKIHIPKLGMLKLVRTSLDASLV